MSQVVETAASRRRRRNMRTAVILVILVAFLGGAFYYAASYFNKPSAPQTSSGCATSDITAGAGGTLTPSQVTVNVYNSTTRAGLAADTAKSVKQRGFVTGKVANDPLKKNVQGSAELRFGQSGQTAAALVAPLVAGATLVVDARPDATVDLVIGAGFQGLTPLPATATATAPNPC